MHLFCVFYLKKLQFYASFYKNTHIQDVFPLRFFSMIRLWSIIIVVKTVYSLDSHVFDTSVYGVFFRVWTSHSTHRAPVSISLTCHRPCIDTCRTKQVLVYAAVCVFGYHKTGKSNALCHTNVAYHKCIMIHHDDMSFALIAAAWKNVLVRFRWLTVGMQPTACTHHRILESDVTHAVHKIFDVFVICREEYDDNSL